MFKPRHYWIKLLHRALPPLLLPLLLPGAISTGGFLRSAGLHADPPFQKILCGPSGREFQKLEKRALELVGSGEIDSALPYFRRMAKLQPYNERALYLLALALLYRKKVTEEEYLKNCHEAIRLLENCVELQTRFRNRSRPLGLRYFYLGMAFWFGGDSLQALKAFQNSYRADFERLDAIYNQYAILEEMGRSGEAAEIRNQYEKLSRFVNIDD